MPRLGVGATLSRSGFPSEFNIYSLMFDGSIDYIDCGESSSLDVTTGDISISVWVKMDTLSGVDVIAGKRANAGGSPGYSVFIETNQVHFKVGGASVNRDVTGAAILNTGEWYHIVCTFDYDGASYIYLNGIEYGTTATNTTGSLTNTDTFRMGQDNIAGRYFDGQIDEVGVWDVALDADAVWDLYTDGTVGPEMITTANDRDFGNNAGSTNTSNWAGYGVGVSDIDEGTNVLRINYQDNTSNLNGAEYTLPANLITGRTYRFTLDLQRTAGTVDKIIVQAGGVLSSLITITTSKVNYSVYITATSTTSNLKVIRSNAGNMDAGDIFEFDNISVKEVLGRASRLSWDYYDYDNSSDLISWWRMGDLDLRGGDKLITDKVTTGLGPDLTTNSGYSGTTDWSPTHTAVKGQGTIGDGWEGVYDEPNGYLGGNGPLFQIVVAPGFKNPCQRMTTGSTGQNYAFTTTSNSIPLVAGRVYKIEFKYRASESFKFLHGTQGWFNVSSNTGDAVSITKYLRPTSSMAVGNKEVWFYFQSTTPADAWIEVDEVRVREVLGNPGLGVNLLPSDFKKDTP